MSEIEFREENLGVGFPVEPPCECSRLQKGDGGIFGKIYSPEAVRSLRTSVCWFVD